MHNSRMPADCNQTVVKNPKAGENPDSKNMRLHCERYIKASEALAAEADASAKGSYPPGERGKGQVSQKSEASLPQPV
jgi:hypothetical protein